MKIATRYLVRSMHLADIPQVLEIERESFPTMWPPTAFRRELQQNRLANYIVIVEHNPSAPDEASQPEKTPGALGRFFGEIRSILGAEDNGPLPPVDQRAELLVGVVGVWMMPDEAHIVTIATRESHRRRGIAERLLIAAIEMAQARHQPLLTLEVRVSNEPALALYEKYGFEQVGRRHRYYSDNHEDAYILTINSVLTRRFREMFEPLRADHARRWGDFQQAVL
ncbi:MAG: ribosomal protein S18-alanine N-acetyltransferase [Chloroflexota bacterium]